MVFTYMMRIPIQNVMYNCDNFLTGIILYRDKMIKKSFCINYIIICIQYV